MPGLSQYEQIAAFGDVLIAAAQNAMVQFWQVCQDGAQQHPGDGANVLGSVEFAAQQAQANIAQPVALDGKLNQPNVGMGRPLNFPYLHHVAQVIEVEIICANAVTIAVSLLKLGASAAFERSIRDPGHLQAVQEDRALQIAGFVQAQRVNLFG